MTDYPELGPIRVDTSFTGPHSGGRDFLGEPLPRERYSRHSGQTQPRVRDITWISTGQSQPPSTHTPQTARYVPPPGLQPTRTHTPTPGPVLRKSAPTISDSELDAEYMTVSVDDRDECNYQGHPHGFNEVVPAVTNAKSEKRNNFVGGFVNGLRRLPKVMSKSRLKDHGKPERQGTGPSTIDTPRMALSRYTGPPIPMPMPGIPTSNSDDIPAVERLETPPRASSASPRPRQGNPADSDVSLGDGRREHLMLPAVRERSFEHALHPPHAHSHSDDTSSSIRPPFEREGDLPNAMSTPILADASIRVSSPILAEPRPSADFMKMESPIRPPPAESVRSQIARAGKFIRDINRLPWIASSGVSSIYVPGESTTRRCSRPIHKNKGSSWYTSRAKPIDLFAGPSTTGLLPPQPPPPSAMTPGHSQSIFPAPFILGSSANLLFTQPVHGGGSGGGGGGGSASSPSHEGPPSTDSHGSQAQVLAPAYVAQPLFVYPSGLPQAGGSPDAQMPRPVYMLANSHPHFMSGPTDGGSGPMGPRLFVPQPSGLRTPTFG